VAHQIRSDDSVVLRQKLNHLVPLPGAAGDAMYQDHRRSLSRNVEVHAVAVQRDLSPLDTWHHPDVPVAPPGVWLWVPSLTSRTRRHSGQKYKFVPIAAPEFEQIP
jgi:hypothetical protein